MTDSKHINTLKKTKTNSRHSKEDKKKTKKLPDKYSLSSVY